MFTNRLAPAQVARATSRRSATGRVVAAARTVRKAGISSPSTPLRATLSKEPLGLGAPPPPPPPLDATSGAAEQGPTPRAAVSSEIAIIHHQDLSLTIHAPQHGLDNARFTYIWLRDSCQGPESLDPGTRQKVHRSSDVPPDIFPLDTSLVKASDGGDVSLKITWSAPLLPSQSEAARSAEAADKASLQTGQGNVTLVTAYEPTTSVYPMAFLAQYASPAGWDSRTRQATLSPLLWSKSTLAALPAGQLRVPYDSFLQSDEVRWAALRQLVQRGLIFFDGVSPEKKSGWQTELKTLVERMGEMRRTFYGDLWDVRSEGKGAINVAYTNANLDIHADLVFVPSPSVLEPGS